jgi:hypothetical protein
MIVGVDASVTALGLALPGGELLTIRARAGAADPARRLHELARAFEHALRRFPPRPELVLIEGYSHNPKGITSAFRLGKGRRAPTSSSPVRRGARSPAACSGGSASAARTPS